MSRIRRSCRRRRRRRRRRRIKAEKRNEGKRWSKMRRVLEWMKCEYRLEEWRDWREN